MTLKNVNKNNQFYNRIMWKICHNLHAKKISKLFSLAGMTFQSNKPVTWEKVFKNGPSKICGRAFKLFEGIYGTKYPRMD